MSWDSETNMTCTTCKIEYKAEISTLSMTFNPKGHLLCPKCNTYTGELYVKKSILDTLKRIAIGSDSKNGTDSSN